MHTKEYNIITESSIGLEIYHSRSSVYDVMEAYEEDYNLYEISRLYNLTPLQAETALDYIAKHRQTLEPELKRLLRKKAERQRYYPGNRGRSAKENRPTSHDTRTGKVLRQTRRTPPS
jgi:hypothetical protein